MVTLASLMPPAALSLLSIRVAFQPFRSAYRRYMRSTSAAKSPASSPPAPARTSRITLRSSFGSLGRSRILRRSLSCKSFSRRGGNSSRARSRISASLSSSRAVWLSTSRRTLLYSRKVSTSGSSWARSFATCEKRDRSPITSGFPRSAVKRSNLCSISCSFSSTFPNAPRGADPTRGPRRTQRTVPDSNPHHHVQPGASQQGRNRSRTRRSNGALDLRRLRGPGFAQDRPARAARARGREAWPGGRLPRWAPVQMREGGGVYGQGRPAPHAAHARQARRPARRGDRDRQGEGRGPHAGAASAGGLSRRQGGESGGGENARHRGPTGRRKSSASCRGRRVAGRVRLRSLQEGEEAAQAGPRGDPRLWQGGRTPDRGRAARMRNRRCRLRRARPGERVARSRNASRAGGGGQEERAGSRAEVRGARARADREAGDEPLPRRRSRKQR